MLKTEKEIKQLLAKTVKQYEFEKKVQHRLLETISSTTINVLKWVLNTEDIPYDFNSPNDICVDDTSNIEDTTLEGIKYLNNKLCEICGVKPIYGVYVNYGDLDNDYRLVTNKRLYKLIAETRWQVDDESIFRNLKPDCLPDFTIPSNLVQLFKILNDAVGKIDIVAPYTGNKPLIFEQSVLEHCVFVALSNNKFKKAVCEADWYVTKIRGN